MLGLQQISFLCQLRNLITLFQFSSAVGFWDKEMSRAFVSLKHFEVNFPVFWRMSKRAKNNQRSSSASQSPGTSGSPYPLGLASCSLLLPSALSFHRRCIFCCFGCMKRISLQCSMMMAKHKRTIALKEFISF